MKIIYHYASLSHNSILFSSYHPYITLLINLSSIHNHTPSKSIPSFYHHIIYSIYFLTQSLIISLYNSIIHSHLHYKNIISLILEFLHLFYVHSIFYLSIIHLSSILFYTIFIYIPKMIVHLTHSISQVALILYSFYLYKILYNYYSFIYLHSIILL